MNTPQLPLGLRSPPDQRLDAFLGNDPARAAVGAAARGEAGDWLFLAGPPGSGKSHLLLAACAEAVAAGRRAAYLPMAAFAGRLASGLAQQEGADLVCLDGLEFIAGNAADEEALFHFHNRARAADSAVLYAARGNPGAIGLQLRDLVTRLGQCARFTLEPLDEDGRRAVLRQRAARRGLELDEAVLDYLLRRVDRDLASLTRLLDQLDRASLAAQRRITIPFLRQQLG
ncbi:MAG: DnaA regulatory inactivator Hda [Arenimonas sp. SCN 70-307]|uniref:DnaA regulatory inactivator Hda n=1 Tax=Arenimonas sp. SCN 70-307 TaxID=1660089 RepID=UPI0008699512|nr:DnaA regulatory inactivator Hda [Arenimonas sp. SCN 70-307]ODS63011.1 MAG: DnaA regulatory inactivator Hda [Arenimonas sp. SCN 70-307]